MYNEQTKGHPVPLKNLDRQLIVGERNKKQQKIMCKIEAVKLQWSEMIRTTVDCNLILLER